MGFSCHLECAETLHLVWKCLRHGEMAFSTTELFDLGYPANEKKNFFGNALNFFPFSVFSNSPYRETPKNALKKQEVRTYFVLRAGADVRRFPVLFVLPPLDWQEAAASRAIYDSPWINPVPPGPLRQGLPIALPLGLALSLGSRPSAGP